MYVYILKSIELDAYKIGITRRTPQQRTKEFSKLPFDVNLVFYEKVKNYRNLEKHIHSLYKNYRINGEWYSLSLEQIWEIMILIEENKLEEENEGSRGNIS